MQHIPLSLQHQLWVFGMSTWGVITSEALKHVDESLNVHLIHLKETIIFKNFT